MLRKCNEKEQAITQEEDYRPKREKPKQSRKFMLLYVMVIEKSTIFLVFLSME